MVNVAAIDTLLIQVFEIFPVLRSNGLAYGDDVRLWVEFKCPICSQELKDDRDLANFLVCKNNSHGLLRFYTGDGCFFTTDHKVAEALLLKGRKVHVSDPKGFVQLE